MAIKANLVIDQGTSFSATIDVTNTGGSIFNLTGYTTAAQMRKNYNSSTAVTFSTSHNGINGQITLTLSAANTISLSL